MGLCYEHCPPGTLPSDDGTVCRTDPCLHYTPDRHCKSCVSPHLLHGYTCIESCPAATYPAELQCLDCMQGCDLCFSLSYCNLCQPAYFWHDGICLQECPTATYALAPSTTPAMAPHCMDCPLSCLACTGQTCSLCADGYYLSPNSQCLPYCMQGFFLIEGHCQTCSPGCTACTSA